MDKRIRRIPGRCDWPGSREVDIQRNGIIKKLEEVERTNKKRSTEKEKQIDLETIIIAGVERGLSMADIRKMQIGQVVDFCIAYNEREKEAERKAKAEEKHGGRRRATQNDINAFFG